MSRRTSSPPNVPCLVAVICPDDAEPAKAFYNALFGWEYENIAGPDLPPFYIASLDGDRVATVAGSGNGEPGVWITAVSVASREDAARAVNDAGGSAPPGDTTEIATIGRFHRVEDPAGMEIHLAEVNGTAVERVEEPGAWSMSVLRLDEPEAVSTFYAAVFGWKLEPVASATMFRLPGHVGAGPEAQAARDAVAVLESTREVPELRGGWMPDFRVADIDVARQAAVAHGGRVISALDSVRAGYPVAALADPGGATFTISQPT